MNIFKQAHKNLPLSPTERAFLKLFYGTVGTAALAGATAAIQYIGSNMHSVNWSIVLTVFIGAFGATLIETGRKYVTAHGDGPLGAATQLISAAIQKASAQPPVPTTKSAGN